MNISAKVWSYTGEKWSGQSEKLPLHRVLDLSILICRSLAHFREAYRNEHLYDPQAPVIDRIGLQGDAIIVAICTDNEKMNEDIKLFSQALSDDTEMISERLRTLSEILNDMGYVNVFQSLLRLTFAAVGLASGVTQPLQIFIVIENLGQNKQFLQWLVMTNGAAMLVGGAVIMGIAKKVKPQLLLMVGLLVTAVCTIGIGASTMIWLTIVLLVISGFFYPCIQGGIQTLIVRNTQGAFIGRVSGAIMPVFMGMMVIGMFISGYLKDTFSL